VLGIYDSFYANDTTRGNISNIYFDNIRCNNYDSTGTYTNEYDSAYIKDDTTHFIRDNIYFGGIKYNSMHTNSIYLSGYNDVHVINNIFIEAYFINGKKVTGVESIGKNEFVKNVVIE
jgi:hypothetical protein